MRFNHTGTLLKIFALTTALYLPQATASQDLTLGTLGLPVAAGADFYDVNVNSGVFTDTYDFSVASNASLSGNLSSSFQYVTAHGNVSNFSLGVKLVDAQLVDLTTSQTTVLSLAQTGPATVGPYTFYSDKLSFNSPVALTAGDSYELAVDGIGGSSLSVVSTQGHYQSNLSAIAIPEPKLLALIGLGLPMLAWLERRKHNQQSKLSLIA